MATSYSHLFSSTKGFHQDWQRTYKRLAGVLVAVYKKPVSEEVRPYA
jgi:hypothetical protein